MEKLKEIFPKMSEIKEIIIEKIKTFEDYNINKTNLLNLVEQIELILNQICNKNEIIQKEPQENMNQENNIKENPINNINEEIKENDLIKSEENNDENNNNNEEEEEESEKNSLPKLNFDYDKNINEILNNIKIEQNKPFIQTFSENDNNIDNNIVEEKEENNKAEKEIPIYPKEIPPSENKNILNNLHNGYSNLFSFNQDLSNINNKSSFTTEEITTKNKVMNLNKEDEDINNNISNEEKINNENDNIKNSKALRVADIIMKLNSNDILYDIITQLYSKEILDKLMSPDVDINLINIIEQTIEKITILENDEIQKLRNKEASISNNKEIKNNNNFNNYNKLNVPKKIKEYKKYKSSSSFYDKSKNSSMNSISSIYNNNYPPKKISSYKKNKSKTEMHLNSEILQNYPKTGKTILGYEKFKKDRNREFNFERSLRNGNYDDNYNYNILKRNYNLNISKADSIKSHSYYSINGNNRNLSHKKMIFNNYTSPFGDYFDSSLQKGGESKLSLYPKRKRMTYFRNARSPVKDYIDGLNEAFV